MSSRISDFLQELKRRRVFRVAAVYLVVGFGIIQGAEPVIPRIGLPDWIVTFIVVLVLLGFPIALVLAWAFEVTPEGVRSTELPAGQPGIGASKSAVALLVLLGVAVGSVGAWWFLRPQGSSEPRVISTRISFLAFENNTGDPSLDPIGRLAVDRIRNVLMQLGGLDLVAAGTVPPTDDASLPSDPILRLAAFTKSALVVAGSYSMIGDSVVFNVELVDGETGAVIPIVIQQETGDPEDPRESLSRLSDRVAGGVAAHFSRDWLPVPGYSVPSIRAFRELEIADQLFGQNKQVESIDYYLRAYEYDTLYHGSLSMAMAAYWNMQGENERYRYLADSLRAYLEVRLDTMDPVQRLNFEWMRTYMDDDLDGFWNVSQQMYQMDRLSGAYPVGLAGVLTGRWADAAEALALREDVHTFSSENWPAWWYFYTHALHHLGEHDAELREARELRALPTTETWTVGNEMRALAALGRASELWVLVDSAYAILGAEYYGETLEDIARELYVHGDTTSYDSLMVLVLDFYREQRDSVEFADALSNAGRIEEAYSVWESLAKGSDDVMVLGALGATAALLDLHAVADGAIQRLETLGPPYSSDNLQWQANVHGALGRCSRAVDLYERALQRGLSFSSSFGGGWWHRDWTTEPVWGCAEFASLIAPRV